jgi:hypothetical protein
MSNPYEAPRAPIGPETAVGVRSGLRSDLRSVALAQKGILVCILLQIALVVINGVMNASQAEVPMAARLVLLFVMLANSVAQLVFVFWLAIKVYNVALGIVLGILALIPCVCLIVLLIVNQKAVSVLSANGHKVGLLGANLAEFPAT